MDDLLGEGAEVTDGTMLEVKREFHLGAWDVRALRFKGRQLTQMANYETPWSTWSTTNMSCRRPKSEKKQTQTRKVVVCTRSNTLPWWPWKHWMSGGPLLSTIVLGPP